MTGKEALKAAPKSTQDIVDMYLGDLSDADFLVRPVPSANNIAWQLGHLITSEVWLMKDLPGANYPETGLDMADYGKETAQTGPRGGYLTKPIRIKLRRH